ncbi:hypothetical protein NDU88_007689 [Pleurodeles waltl]|uniref:Uncharacterized protein n=1 Tax=Pleurodeles waltl TaxID=8319 RepID=A0AAV7NVL3_PLEWA|nr:hypothetical protein NDU88_007689 [Pleurodeles waltl]
MIAECPRGTRRSSLPPDVSVRDDIGAKQGVKRTDNVKGRRNGKLKSEEEKRTEDAERMDRGNLQRELGNQQGRKGGPGKKKKGLDCSENEVRPRVRAGEGETGRPATLLEESGFSRYGDKWASDC